MKVAVAGSGGRMGRTLVELILGSGDLALSGALEAAGHPALGRDAAAGVRITADAAAALKGAGCLIDFTTPEATLVHLEACVGAKVPMVIGTTGLSGPERKRVAAAAERIAIVFAPNMAVGVNVLFKLA